MSNIVEKIFRLDARILKKYKNQAKKVMAYEEEI